MTTKHLPHRRLYIAAVALAMMFGRQATAEPAPNYAPSKKDTALAVNQPDEFAWKLFCALSRPAENGHPRDIVWETWPEQGEIYANPFIAPKWPSDEHRDKGLVPSLQHHVRRRGSADGDSLPLIPGPRDGVANEEVRDNQDAFDYIVKNNLWYKEGIVEKTTNGQISFPPGSIAIKGKWKIITEKQKPRFHWHEYTDPMSGEPVAVGLVALHIASRVIPTWHWSTFEQVDNLGLADYIGLHDSFGIVPHDIAPNRLTNQGYSVVHGKPKRNVGVLTPALRQMMEESGLSPALSNHYRLKGAQIAFADPTGRPTIVGNSVTEAGFVATSSCITCHARASIGAPSQGQNNFPVPPPLSVFTTQGQSHNGPVDPSWYWYPIASYSSPPAEPEAFHKPMEFLWQLVFLPKLRQPESK